jgi:hypothetical protein
MLLFGILATAGCSGDKPSGQCSGFQQCGGNVEGKWSIESSCVDGNLVAVANLNPKLTAACQGMYQAVDGSMVGTVAFSAGVANLDTKLMASYQLNVNADCARSLGVGVLDASTCASLPASLVQNQLCLAAQCTMSGANCACAATDEFPTVEVRNYSISGASIAYSANADGTNSGGNLAFCVEGDVLHGRQFDRTILSTVFINARRQP